MRPHGVLKMAGKYSELIKRFCESRGIEIPLGFHRGSASRYAIVQQTTPPKLIARTWFKQEDVVYYLEHMADGTPVRIFDFKETEELVYDGGKKLIRVGGIEGAET